MVEIHLIQKRKRRKSMQNLEQRVAERRDMATNMQELREAYNWLAEETYAVANANMQLEAAIIEKYGAKALIELQDKDISAERINTDYKMLSLTEQMLAYGYTGDDIKPVEFQYAISMFSVGYDVYLLHPDNTRTKAKSVEEIKNFNGILGVEQAEVDRRRSALEEAILGK